MLDNPSSLVQLPEEVEKAVKLANGQVKVAQQELKNIRDTRISEEAQIKELIKHKADLEVSISELEEKFASSEEKNLTLTADNVRIQNESQKITALNLEITSKYDQVSKEIEEMTAILEKKIAETEKGANALAYREEEFSVKEIKLTKFVNRLNEVLKDYGKC